MRSLRWWFTLAAVAAAGIGVVCGGGPAARADDPAAFDFEDGAQGWVSQQPESPVTTTQDPNHVKSGKAALEWSYDPAKDNSQVLVPDPHLKAGGGTLDFWVRTEHPGAYQLLFIERSGAQYYLGFRTPSDRWQHVRANLSDLVLRWTKDDNGQLDLDQVLGILLLDGTRFDAANETLPHQKLWLDGMRFTKDDVPQRRYTEAAGQKLTLFFDDFEDAETLFWDGPLHAETHLEKADGHSVLKVTYNQGKDSKRIFSLTDQLDPRYSQMKVFAVTARATHPTRLGISFREWDGGYDGPNYAGNLPVIPGDHAWHTVQLPVGDLHFTTGNADDNKKFDMGVSANLVPDPDD